MKRLLILFVLLFSITAAFSQIQKLNVGTSPSDGTGDKLRDGMIKINSNFAYVDTFAVQRLDSLITSGGTKFLKVNVSSEVNADSATDVQLGTHLSDTDAGNIKIGDHILKNLIPGSPWLGSPYFQSFKGDRNIAIGYDLANNWSTVNGNQGTSNILMGVRAGKNTNPFGFSIVMGWETAANIVAQPAHWESMIAMGTYAMNSATINSSASPAHSNIMAIGTYAGYQADFIDGFGTTLLGESAGYNATLLEDYEILIGGAGQNAALGRGNIGIGERAFYGSVGGTAGSTGIGTNQFNVAVGVHAMEGAGPSEKGTYVGTEAGQGVVIGQKNTGYGSWSLPRVNGHHNMGIGPYAGFMSGTTITGNGNAFIGPSTGLDATTTNVSNVMVIGNPSGITSTSGFRPVATSDKVYIGSTGDIELRSDYDGTSNTLTFNTTNGAVYGTQPSSVVSGSLISRGWAESRFIGPQFVGLQSLDTEIADGSGFLSKLAGGSASYLYSGTAQSIELFSFTPTSNSTVAALATQGFTATLGVTGYSGAGFSDGYPQIQAVTNESDQAYLKVKNLPTTNPCALPNAGTGTLWVDAGVLKVCP